MIVLPGFPWSLSPFVTPQRRLATGFSSGNTVWPRNLARLLLSAVLYLTATAAHGSAADPPTGPALVPAMPSGLVETSTKAEEAIPARPADRGVRNKWSERWSPLTFDDESARSDAESHADEVTKSNGSAQPAKGKESEGRADPQKAADPEQAALSGAALESDAAAESNDQAGQEKGAEPATAEKSDSDRAQDSETSKPPLSDKLIQLRTKVRRCLDFYYTDRCLNTRDDSPWSVMHALIGYGIDTHIHIGGPGGRRVNAISWLCGNGTCRGMKLLYLRSGQLGVALGPGLQGHECQFLAMLAQSRVMIDYPIIVNRKRMTVADLVRIEKHTCRPNSELTFKLIGLSHYLDPDATWKDVRGRQWSIQRLIREELAAPINGATCGGTHRLMGFSYSVRKRKQSGRPVIGQWARAQKFIEQWHRYALRFQNRDGSFSTSYFRARDHRPDIGRRLETTGHILEWLVYSLPADQLDDPKVVRSAEYLADLMLGYRNRKLPVGPRGHAIRALVLYDERVFGAVPGQRRVQLAKSGAPARGR